MTYSAPVNPFVGNKGIVFTLALIDAATGTPGPALAFDGDVKNVKPSASDRDAGDLTFREAEEGDLQDFALAVTALATLEVGSLCRLLWDNPGAEFEVVWAPHNNAIPTADKPHITGTVKASGKPFTFEQAASKDKGRGSYDYTFNFTDGPTLDTGA